MMRTLDNCKRKVVRLTGILAAYDTTPQDVITTLLFGAPDSEPTASMVLTTFIPSITSPNTTCLSSSHEVTTVVMKNCHTRMHTRRYPNPL